MTTPQVWQTKQPIQTAHLPEGRYVCNVMVHIALIFYRLSHCGSCVNFHKIATPSSPSPSVMRQLNQEQIDFVYQVLHHIKTSPEPIFRFLSGGAGVGKTFVTKMLYQALIKYMNKMPWRDPSFPFINLLAPIEKATYLLKGSAIHSALKVPINQSMEYHSLDADRLNTLRTQLAQVQLIIFDNLISLSYNLDILSNVNNEFDLQEHEQRPPYDVIYCRPSCAGHRRPVGVTPRVRPDTIPAHFVVRHLGSPHHTVARPTDAQ